MQLPDVITRRTDEEIGGIIAFGFQPLDGLVRLAVAKTVSREALEHAARLLRERLAEVEAEIATHP